MAGDALHEHVCAEPFRRAHAAADRVALDLFLLAIEERGELAHIHPVLILADLEEGRAVAANDRDRAEVGGPGDDYRVALIDQCAAHELDRVLRAELRLRQHRHLAPDADLRL